MMTNSQLPPSLPPIVPAPPAAFGTGYETAPTSPYTSVPASEAPKGNGLGIASLIVGIIAFFGSFVPFINYTTGFVAFIALVLGVIALFLKGRGKKAAIAGVIVSVVALILSIVLAIAYTAGFAAAVSDAGVDVDSSQSGTTDEGTTETAPDEAPIDQGTRENPYPIGTMISFTDNGAPFYDITVGAPTLNANDVIAATNQFNEAPAAGTQFAILPLTVTYTGSETGTPWMDISAEFVAADGTSHDSSDTFVVGPAPLMDLNELYPAGSGTGNIVINIPTEGAEQGTWLLKVGLFAGDEVFFAAQ
jgi:hypothetical protein